MNYILSITAMVQEFLFLSRDRRGHDCMLVGLQLPMHSVPITTNVVSSNPAQARSTGHIM